MNISQKDDYKTCTFCDRTGHIYRHCRQRTEALEKRAMAELVQQTNETERMEEGEPGHREMQEDQPPNSQPQTPASDTCTTTSPLPQLQLTPSTTTSTPTPQLVPTQVLHTLTPYTSTQEITYPTAATPSTSTQEVAFVPGGNLATVTNESYPTPSNQPIQTDRPAYYRCPEDIIFYRNEDDVGIENCSYYDLQTEEDQTAEEHYKRRRRELKDKGETITPEIKQQLRNQAYEHARVEMAEGWESIWEQFIAERQRREQPERQSEGT